MSKIKICGLSRLEDIAYVNMAKPDYAGFILQFPKSHRNVSIEQLQELKKALSPEIRAVGVFVDQPVELVAGIAEGDLIDLIQLHGQEDEAYIKRLRIHTDKPVIQAFQVKTKEEIKRAENSSADYILLDAGQGAGKTFDWQLLKDVARPYFLAGGIGPLNIEEAIRTAHPFAVDLSSGVETDKKKDQLKILEVTAKTRSM
ncbi:MAG: phosphoribosylanthranilate isomerase [Hespellia sp.]|nr:phosphoribosylanthranilate isomerase [Hespellia sp.]